MEKYLEGVKSRTHDSVWGLNWEVVGEAGLDQSSGARSLFRIEAHF